VVKMATVATSSFCDGSEISERITEFIGVPSGLRKTCFGMFSVLAALGSRGGAARPKSPVGDFVEQRV
jgi:hypothetical protein